MGRPSRSRARLSLAYRAQAGVMAVTRGHYTVFAVLILLVPAVVVMLLGNSSPAPVGTWPAEIHEPTRLGLVGVAYPRGSDPPWLGEAVAVSHGWELLSDAGEITVLTGEGPMRAEDGWTFLLRDDGSPADARPFSHFWRHHDIAWLLTDQLDLSGEGFVALRPLRAWPAFFRPSDFPGLHRSSQGPPEALLAGRPFSSLRVETDRLTIIRPPCPLEGVEVGVYSGAGSWDQGSEAIMRFLDHYGISWSQFDQDQMDELEDRFDIIWFPGGFSAQYRLRISDHDRIRQFVEAGGRFVGTCAGAYYASGMVVWGGTPTDYPLNLMAGSAVGPMTLRWGKPTSLALTPDHPANYGFPAGLDIYYMDGPYFQPEEGQDIEVIARYELNNQPAVISFHYGQGRGLLIGPHPEMGFDGATGRFDLDGGGGAAWPWLYSMMWSLY